MATEIGDALLTALNALGSNNGPNGPYLDGAHIARLIKEHLLPELTATAVGSFTADGGAMIVGGVEDDEEAGVYVYNARMALGTPISVRITNETDGLTWQWITGMAADTALQIGGDTDGPGALIAVNGITVAAGQFTIGAGAINVNDEDLHYEVVLKRA